MGTSHTCAAPPSSKKCRRFGITEWFRRDLQCLPPPCSEQSEIHFSEVAQSSLTLTIPRMGNPLPVRATCARLTILTAKTFFFLIQINPDLTQNSLSCCYRTNLSKFGWKLTSSQGMETSAACLVRWEASDYSVITAVVWGRHAQIRECTDSSAGRHTISCH